MKNRQSLFLFENSIFIKTLTYNPKIVYVHNLCALCSLESVCNTVSHVQHETFPFLMQYNRCSMFKMTDKENRSLFFRLWNSKLWNLNNIDSHYRNMKTEKWFEYSNSTNSNHQRSFLKWTTIFNVYLMKNERTKKMYYLHLIFYRLLKRAKS